MQINPLTDASRGIEPEPVTTDGSIKLEDINDYVYVAKSVPCGGSPMEAFDITLDGCTCEATEFVSKKSCLGNNCTCLQSFGCVYNTEKCIGDIDPFNKVMKPIYECNRFCKCSPDCINRVTQKGIKVKLQVFKTVYKGIGLKTLEILKKGQFVCEYAGEVLSEKVARFRSSIQSESDHNYILALREHLKNGKVVCTYVDPRSMGNAGRFINHSCEPNLFMVPVRIDNNVPRLAFFTMREIDSGEELSYDYSGDIQRIPAGAEKEDDIETVKLENLINYNQQNGKDPFKICKCGSKFCRGYLPFDESLFK